MPTPRRYPDVATRQKAYRDRQRLARAAELQAKGLPAAPAISTLPSRQRWHGLLEQARIALQTAQEEMQTYWDGRRPVWQESDRGERLGEHIEALEKMIGNLVDLAAPYAHVQGDHHAER